MPSNKNTIGINLLGLLTVLSSLSLCDGYNILVIFASPSTSHGFLGETLVKHLLNAGHQVSYITPFVKNTVPENLTYIDVSITKTAYATNPFNLEKFMNKKINMDQDEIFNLLHNVSKLTLTNENVKKLIEDPTQSFDLVIAEWMFNELYSGFAAVFNCPYIWMFPFEPNFVALSLIDETTNPAYTANLELNIAPPFTFVERVRNLWFQITYQFNRYVYYSRVDESLYEAVFQPVVMKKYGRHVPYEVIKYNASMMVAYFHNSLGQALSMPMNMVAVGGYHVDTKPVPLPADLQRIMDNAENGVIYFSMGTNLKSKDFPKKILNDLIKMFSKIKRTIVWKFEEHLPGCPENVHIVKWVPQQTVLAHPNCVLFITHGGLLSTTEALHYGVPVIGIPVFFDQFSNVDKAVNKGFARKVILSFNFAEDLSEAIDDVFADTRYAVRAKELSYIYHDRPVPPGKELVHWVEHVVVTRGAPHLRSLALHMPWYQKIYLDLAAVALILIYVTFVSFKTALKTCLEYRLKIQTKKLD